MARRGDKSRFTREGNRPSRKTLQLCGQVADTLNYVLSGELDDDVLRNLWVARVEPAPDASRLVVTVTPMTKQDEVEPVDVLQRLHLFSGRLRSEVAASITRRKAPELIFQFATPDLLDADAG